MRAWDPTEDRSRSVQIATEPLSEANMITLCDTTEYGQATMNQLSTHQIEPFRLVMFTSSSC